MIDKLLGGTHPRPSWTLVQDGKTIHFGPRPWSVLWSRIKQITLFSLILVPCANASNDYNYKNKVNAGRDSISNQTDTPLTAFATFTGVAEYILDYSQINVVALADSTGTLSMQFSPDGTNWDRKITVSVSSGASEAHTLVVIDPWFRLVYTNGSVAQTSFRLHSTLNKFQSKGLTSRTSQTIDKDKDVDLVRSVANFDLDVARGLYDYIYAVHQFGSNADVDTTAEAIWQGGGTYNFLQVADELRIKVGGNVADDPLSTGAFAIKLFGLDENWVSTSAVIVTSGSAVSDLTDQKFIRLHYAEVTTVGAYDGTNVGNLEIETEGGTTIGLILAGVGHTELGIYSVPSDYTCYLVAQEMNVASNKTANILMWERKDANLVSAPFGAKFIAHREEGVSGDIELHDRTYEAFPEYTDVWFEADTGTNAFVDVTMEMFCVQNSGSPGDPT